MSLGTDYIIKYLADISGAVKGAKELERINANVAKNIQAQYGQVTKIIGSLSPKVQEIPIKVNGKDAIKTIMTTGEVVKTTSGSFLELGKTQTFIQGQLVKTSGSVKDVTSQFVKGNLEAAKGAKVFSNLTDNIKQLAGRALLTIPIWIALRGAIMGSMQAISGGIKDLVAFDLALQKIRNNLQGTPEEVSAAFAKIKSTITETSKATGISTEEIAGAVKQFATLGFSANESLQGALGASKLSIALFGNASDTAEAFAKALNILIDRSAGAKTAADQMNEAFALTSQLEETNNFEIKNVTEALNKFGGTAAGVGLTMNQTLQILAALGTAGRAGAEGATLLSTSFNTLLKNLPNLSKSLGIVVGAGESTFTTFQRILEKVTELNNTPGGRNAAIEAMSDTFGGARGIKIVQSLVAVKNILDANVAILPDFDALNKKVARTLESESGQAKLLGNNLKEAGKSFVTALIGSEDFTSSLIKLNRAVSSVTEGLKPLGTTIHVVFSNLGLIAGAGFLLKWEKTLTETAILKGLLKSQLAFAVLGNRLGFIFGGSWISAASKSLGAAGLAISLGFRESFIRGFSVLGGLIAKPFLSAFGASMTLGAGGILGAAITAALSPIVLLTGVIGKLAGDTLTDNIIKGIESKNSKMQSSFNKVIDGLKGNLAVPDLKILINKLSTDKKSLTDSTKQEIAALKIQLEKQLAANEIKISAPIEVEPLISFKEEQDLAKLIVERGVERVKQEGALTSEALKYKDLLYEIFDIKEDAMEATTRQSEIDRAIADENIERNNVLLNDSIERLKLEGKSNAEILIATELKKEQLKISQNSIESLEKQKAIERAIAEENIEIDKLLLKDSIERLKQQGASNSQILIATQLKSEQLNIQENGNTKLDRQLELERAINEEKRLQSKLSSDTMKLYDIAKTQGVDVAKKIGDVLAGNVDFSSFVRQGGKPLEIFQKEFEDLYKQQQAQQFFQGDRVSGEATSFRGGNRIAIKEEALGKGVSAFDPRLDIAQATVERPINNIQSSVPVNINAQIDISKLNEVKELFIKEVTKQLPKAGSDINIALIHALAGKQGNSL